MPAPARSAVLPTSPSRRLVAAVTALLLLLAGLSVAALAPAATAAPVEAGPTIASDQADYPPGGLVTLTGEGWASGEAVHLTVNDDIGRTWQRDVDVIADDAGRITDEFNLPDWFVATYAVVATGDVSGVARTSFTDGNIQVTSNAADATFVVTPYSSSNCTTGPGSTTNETGSFNRGVGSANSIKLTAVATTPSNRAWVSWGGTFTSLGDGGRTICAPGSSGTASLTVTYTSDATSTSTSVASSLNPSTYGTGVTFTATVSPSPSGAGTVTFKDGATTLCSAVAVTGAQATCSTSTLSAASHPITAQYSGGGSFTGSTSSTLSQVVNTRQVIGSFTAADKPYDGSAAATISGRSLAGAVAGDNVSLTGGTATFADKNVGTGKTVTGTGFSLTGTAAGNYTLASSTLTTTASITRLGVTGAFTAASRDYDGTAVATITGRSITSGVQGNDQVTLTGGTATFGNKNAGQGKTVTGSGFSLGGADAGNYSLTSVATTTADIRKLAITGDFTAAGKEYDATTAATVTGRSLAGAVPGDDVSLSGGTATFGTKSAGDDKTVTLTGAVLAGADKDNYVLGSVDTALATITRKDVTGSFTAANKTYDGTLSATVLTRSLTGVIDGDTVALTGGTATFATKNATDGKTVTLAGADLAGADAGNYRLTSVNTATADIDPLVVSGSFTAAGKVYDGDTDAEVLSRHVAGTISGDDIRLVGGTASFANANVGHAKTVTLTGAALSGDDAPNYSLSGVAGTTADIAAAELVGSFTAASKPYDGSRDATITGRDLAGVLGDDQVSLVGGTALFASKTVGQDKDVEGTGFSLAGDDAGNYALSSTMLHTTADISLATVTGHFTAGNKTYDGTDAATIADRWVTGEAVGDDVDLEGGTATFANKNAGNGKTVTGSGFTLTGADAQNYSLVSDELTTTADIAKREVTGSFTAADRDYDGTPGADVVDRSVHGEVAGDDVRLVGGSATFGSKVAGPDRAVTGTGFSLDGDDAANYSLASSTLTTTATIRRLQVTGAFTADDKVYDGTAAADVLTRTVPGAIAGDTVSLSGGTAAFDDENVGHDKTVTLSGAELSGSDADNYVLDAVDDATADITAKDVRGSFVADDKVYDGNASAVAHDLGLAGTVDGDRVSLSGGTARFDDKNVGDAKAVTLTGAELTGDDARNYHLTGVDDATADITAKAVTGSFSAGNKTYDGNASATITGRSITSGVLEGETVTLEGGSASFPDKSAGTGRTVTGTGFTLGGSDAGNYELTATTLTTTADIARREVTWTFDVSDKVYDGARSASITGWSIGNTVSGDDVSAYGSDARFEDENVANGKTVTLVDAAVTGTDSANYRLVGPVTTTADITQRAVAGTITAASKVYDGTRGATVTRGLAPASGDTGMVAGDDVSLTGGTATFATKNVGTGKTVTLAGAGLSGADAGNYTLSGVATTTADITRRDVAGSFTAAGKVYDGTTAATVLSRSLAAASGDTGTVADDDVALTGGTATFDTPDVGQNKTVTLTGATLTGADAGNYRLTGPATATASITYGWAGFLQPVNDTAHQTGVLESKFKLGQTIPLKFVLNNAAGGVVQQSSNPTFSQNRLGSACDSNAALESTTDTVSATSGGAYTWDGSKYQYNWSTKGLPAGEYRVYASLADGTTKRVDICMTK